MYNSDVTFDFRKGNEITVHNNAVEPWKVTLVDTGLHTMTGGRVKRIKKYTGDEPFMMTYGDGVSDVDLGKLYEFHKSHGKIATVTAVNVGQRFGMMEVDKEYSITAFREKNDQDGGMINAGYMVFEPDIFDYIEGDQTVLEKEPLERLAVEGELKAFFHSGFWKCMDTQRDRQQLEQMWESKKAIWKLWEDGYDE